MVSCVAYALPDFEERESRPSFAEAVLKAAEVTNNSGGRGCGQGGVSPASSTDQSAHRRRAHSVAVHNSHSLSPQKKLKRSTGLQGKWPAVWTKKWRDEGEEALEGMKVKKRRRRWRCSELRKVIRAG